MAALSGMKAPAWRIRPNEPVQIGSSNSGDKKDRCKAVDNSGITLVIKWEKSYEQGETGNGTGAKVIHRRWG